MKHLPVLCLLLPGWIRKVLPAVLAAGLALPAAAQIPNTLLHAIPAPPVGVQSGAQFGYCVAVEGGYTVVGAPYDDIGGFDSGVVKVFDSTTGALLFLLPNPSPADLDSFGNSVAISGTRVVVGASLDSTGAIHTGSAYVYDLSGATPTVPVAALHKPGPAAVSYFGISVAISGTRVVVGAPFDDTGATDAGSAYVYDLSRATPTVPVATLHKPSLAEGDKFGWSVAISGTRVVVGAPFDDTGAPGAGSAYVYDLSSRTPTVPVATLNNPGPALNDSFGNSVAISGTRVVVAAAGDDAGATDAGSAYVFDLSGATPTVPVATLHNPDPTAGSVFGNSVAISGTRVVVGAYQFASVAIIAGSAYVYDLSAVTPTVPVATLHSPGPALNIGFIFFGTSVAISGTRVVVGAGGDDTGATDSGSAYVYDLSGATPTVPVATLHNPSPTASDSFGWSVAISGTRAVMGAPSDSTGAPYAGSAYVYDPSSGTPTVPVATLNNPSPSSFDNFGISVAISGTRLVVGASGDDTGATDAGSAYVYDLTGATPTVPVATLNNPGPAADDRFGTSVAISGTRLVVAAPFDDTGATDAGSAYVYDLSGATPTVPVATLHKPGPTADDGFGSSVAISGTRVVVGAGGDDTGATRAGSAYVYDLSSGTSTVPVATLHNPGPSVGDGFGSSVAISGVRVVVGAAGDNTGATDAGSAYVYDLSRATPTVPVATLHNPRPATGDLFGWSVAVSGTRVVVGAIGDDTGVTNTGSAYVYDLSGARPTVPVATLNNPAPADSDYFGWSVAIDGTSVAIGTPYDDSPQASKGSAYIFGPGNTTTLTPTLTAPATGTTTGNPVSVVFTLPAAAKTGSMQLSFSGAVTRVLKLAAAQEASGTHSFSFDPANPTSSPQVATGSAIPDGVYRVVLSYQDALGHPVASATSTKVTLDTVTKAPTLALPATGSTTGSPVSVDLSLPEKALAGSVTLTFTGAGTQVLTLAASREGAGAHTFIFDPANPTASPGIASGSAIPDGTYAVALSYQDAVGNAAATATSTNVTITSALPGTAQLARKGSVVPGADVDPRIPAGATWGVFGEPSITREGTLAGWLATVLPPVPALAFTGIFSGPLDAPALRLKKGEGVTDAAGAPVTGGTFSTFRPPVFAGGDFAFGATVAGTGISTVNDTGIWASVGGTLREVAREGKVAPGAGTAKFLAFTSVAMPAPDTVFFVATLVAPATKNMGLWRWTSAGGTQKVLCEGDPMDLGAGLSPLLSFKALTSVVGSPGHGRYDADTGAIDVLLTQVNKTQAIRSIAADGSVNGTQRTGVPDGGGRVPLAFEVPSSPGMGEGGSVRTTFALNAGGITATNNSAILDGDGQTILAQKGTAAADAGPAKFRAFKEPVAGFDAGGKRVTAFAATLSGSTPTQDTGIWKHTEGGTLTLVAREGAAAADAGSAKWTSFTSLAVLEDRGPMFTAKLLGGVTAANNTGLWATDSTGVLRKILRTGDTITGKKLKSFNVLGAVAGTPGQRRAWTVGDASARVIYLAFFTDGSSAVLSTAVP